MITPRPLYWVKGIGRQDPATVEHQLENLLADGPSVLRTLEDLGFACVKELTARNRVKRDDEAVVVLTGVFLDATSTSRMLIKKGHTKGACLQIRVMIECHLLSQYIKDDARRAEQWARASSGRERRAFSFDAVYEQVPDSAFWKQWWDGLNEVVHSNRGAAPAHYRIRPIFGIDMYIGAYFDPIPQSRLFLETLVLCQAYIEQLGLWYQNDLEAKLISDVRDIADQFSVYARELQARADQAWNHIMDDPGTVSLQEQNEAAKALGLPGGISQPRDWREPLDLPLVPSTS